MNDQTEETIAYYEERIDIINKTSLQLYEKYFALLNNAVNNWDEIKSIENKLYDLKLLRGDYLSSIGELIRNKEKK